MATKLAPEEISGLDPYKFMAVIGKRIYASAGLTGLDIQTGPFEMMTARGFLADEGMARCLAIMSTVAGRPGFLQPGGDRQPGQPPFGQAVG